MLDYKTCVRCYTCMKVGRTRANGRQSNQEYSIQSPMFKKQKRNKRNYCCLGAVHCLNLGHIKESYRLLSLFNKAYICFCSSFFFALSAFCKRNLYNHGAQTRWPIAREKINCLRLSIGHQCNGLVFVFFFLGVCSINIQQLNSD